MTEKKNQFLELVKIELQRAERLHPDYPDDHFKQLAILSEEAGEVSKAVIDHHYEAEAIDHIAEELIQTAAMCMRMFINL